MSIFAAVTVTIVPPTVVNVNEGEGPVEVCVALVNQAPLGRPVSVVLSTADITAVGEFVDEGIGDQD